MIMDCELIKTLLLRSYANDIIHLLAFAEIQTPSPCDVDVLREILLKTEQLLKDWE